MDPLVPRSAVTSGETATPWLLASGPTRFAPLERNLQTDVCVVGAGIAGLTTALVLARSGRDVVVLEDGLIGSGETGRTTAHLTAVLDDRYEEIEKLHGAQAARSAADSQRSALDFVEKIVRVEKIDCGFERVSGYLVPSSEDDVDRLSSELVAARRAGFEDVEWLEHAPFAAFRESPALHFPKQAQLHPMKYLHGLADALVVAGGRIFTGTHASGLDHEGTAHVVDTVNGARVRCNVVVEATGTPIFERVAIHTKQSAYRSYVVAFDIEPGTVPCALLWDTGSGSRAPFPYHYVRIARAQDLDASRSTDLLIVGGEDHKTGQEDDADSRWERLVFWTQERFPVTGSPRHRWSGQIMEPVDGLAFIGPAPGRAGHYLATGDSGNGMTHGTVAGMLLGDLVLGRNNPWAEIYRPSRRTIEAMPRWAREQANVVAKYGDWLRGRHGPTIDAIARGSGNVIVDGLHRIAVHRDAQGDLHACSAVCPHLGCLVAWNQGEATWDCPCHGSRFDAIGRVLNGPANRDLDAAALPVDERPERKPS